MAALPEYDTVTRRFDITRRAGIVAPPMSPEAHEILARYGLEAPVVAPRIVTPPPAPEPRPTRAERMAATQPAPVVTEPVVALVPRPHEPGFIARLVATGPYLLRIVRWRLGAGQLRTGWAR